MRTPKWICSKCRQPFTRRWNANRHCNNKHYCAIENIISFTEYIINRKDSISLNGFYEENNPSLNVNNLIVFDKPSSFNNSQLNTLSDPLDDAIEPGLLSNELLDQLAPKYEEMQRTLDCMSEPFRTILLGNALSSAIQSKNPLASIDKQLTDFRKAKTCAMMVNDLSTFYGIDKTSTKEYLKLTLKQKKYRHFNSF
jgi:hypothetical protein